MSTRQYNEVDALWLADDAAQRFNQAELDAFREIYWAAKKWAEELDDWIIPGAGSDERADFEDQRDRLRNALMLWSKFADRHDDGE